ncbi:MAG: RNA polymerase sigma factor [Saprospiraceae bacterium]
MDFVLPFNYSEKEFIDACVRNERWAQKRLYEEHYSQMMGVCLRYARNEHDALDILQEGFIKVFRNITKYQPGTTLAAWIRRIMVNTAIDYYRKNIRRRTEDLDTAYELKSMDADAISQCSEKEILEAVQQLTPAYRVVFNLYVIEGYSHREIAELMEITESTSRSNLVKSRMKLRAIINKKL